MTLDEFDLMLNEYEIDYEQKGILSFPRFPKDICMGKSNALFLRSNYSVILSIIPENLFFNTGY